MFSLVTGSTTAGNSSPDLIPSSMNLKSDFERAGALDWMDSMLEGSVAIIITMLFPKMRVNSVLMAFMKRAISWKWCLTTYSNLSSHLQSFHIFIALVVGRARRVMAYRRLTGKSVEYAFLESLIEATFIFFLFSGSC